MGDTCLLGSGRERGCGDTCLLGSGRERGCGDTRLLGSGRERGCGDTRLLGSGRERGRGELHDSFIPILDRGGGGCFMPMRSSQTWNVHLSCVYLSCVRVRIPGSHICSN